MGMTNRTSVERLSYPVKETIIERMVERTNMKAAYDRIVRNNGAPGIDKMTVDKLLPYLNKHWAAIKVKLLNGTYEPQAVRQVSIPKPNGGERLLGIPTVLDRLIQQALHQILNPYFEPEFSKYSFGFQAGKSAHQAVLQAKEYQTEGKRWVVDMDIRKFFDEVNHDRLIMRVKQRVNDKGLLQLLRKYLKAGIMVDGITTMREKGTPQGSPISPLLSNIVLDELDKELERRGHSFCRYADDCNIYVGSKRAGERVMASIRRFVELKLRLRINEDKSAVAKPCERTFLGYSVTEYGKICVPECTIQRFKSKTKRLIRQGRGRNVGRFIKDTLTPFIRGWMNYFRLTEVKTFAMELDRWVRRRLRNIIWRQWKKPLTRYRNLRRRGVSEEKSKSAMYNGKGPWWNSGAYHMNACFNNNYFEKLGLFSMLDFVENHRHH
jgi:RNA-directed DNA polymerase